MNATSQQGRWPAWSILTGGHAARGKDGWRGFAEPARTREGARLTQQRPEAPPPSSGYNIGIAGITRRPTPTAGVATAARPRALARSAATGTALWMLWTHSASGMGPPGRRDPRRPRPAALHDRLVCSDKSGRCGRRDRGDGGCGRRERGEGLRRRAEEEPSSNVLYTTSRGEQRRRLEASKGGDGVAQRASPSLPLEKMTYPYVLLEPG